MLDKNKVRLGIHPMHWTNDDLPSLGKENNFKQAVSEIALAGFVGTEVGGLFPMDTDVLKRELGLRGLSISGWWFSSFLTTRPLEETVKAFKKHVDFLHTMGSKIVVFSEQGHGIQGQMDTPVFSNKPVFTDEEWDKLIKGLHVLASIAAEKDVKIAFHQHMGTGVQTAAELDRLMENTDPNEVFLLFDSGHLAFAGEDPEAILKKYIKRVAHVHLKDVRADIVANVKSQNLSFLQAILNGAFTVPGDGAINFEPLFKILDENNYEGWLVVEAEQDPAKADPLEYAIKARKYIKEKTGL
ncbi:MAG TPA: myo-inosose-2 dehydratase [Clostridium sp.]